LTDRKARSLFSNEALVFDELARALKRNIGAPTKALLKGAVSNEIFDAEVAIPSYSPGAAGILLLVRRLV